MSNCRQQSLKEAFCAGTSTTVENDNVSSDSELRLSDSDIADTPPPEVEIDHTPGEDIADQPSGASGSSTTERSDEEIEIQLLDKPHQPRSGVFPKRQFGQKPEYCPIMTLLNVDLLESASFIPSRLRYGLYRKLSL